MPRICDNIKAPSAPALWHMPSQRLELAEQRNASRDALRIGHTLARMRAGVAHDFLHTHTSNWPLREAMERRARGNVVDGTPCPAHNRHAPKAARHPKPLINTTWSRHQARYARLCEGCFDTRARELSLNGSRRDAGNLAHGPSHQLPTNHETESMRKGQPPMPVTSRMPAIRPPRPLLDNLPTYLALTTTSRSPTRLRPKGS